MISKLLWTCSSLFYYKNGNLIVYILEVEFIESAWNLLFPVTSVTQIMILWFV